MFIGSWKKSISSTLINFFKKNIFKLIIIISIFLFYLSNSIIFTKESLSNQNNFNQIQTQIEEENISTKEDLTKETKENENSSYESSQFLEDEIVQKGKNTDEKWKLNIPKIGLEAQIAEGTTKDILDEYIGHFEETSKINGNIGLAAHNRGYKVNYFKNLKNLKEGDEIIYCYSNIERKYLVKTHEIIKDTDWSFLEDTEENVITLITCVENEPEYRRCIQAIEE